MKHTKGKKQCGRGIRPMGGGSIYNMGGRGPIRLAVMPPGNIGSNYKIIPFLPQQGRGPIGSAIGTVLGSFLPF